MLVNIAYMEHMGKMQWLYESCYLDPPGTYKNVLPCIFSTFICFSGGIWRVHPRKSKLHRFEGDEDDQPGV